MGSLSLDNDRSSHNHYLQHGAKCFPNLRKLLLLSPNPKAPPGPRAPGTLCAQGASPPPTALRVSLQPESGQETWLGWDSDAMAPLGSRPEPRPREDGRGHLPQGTGVAASAGGCSQGRPALRTRQRSSQDRVR